MCLIENFRHVTCPLLLHFNFHFYFLVFTVIPAFHYRCCWTCTFTYAPSSLITYPELFLWQCSVSCGPGGTQSRRLICVNKNSGENYNQTIDTAMCEHRPRLQLSLYKECTAERYCPQWHTGAWSQVKLPHYKFVQRVFSGSRNIHVNL